MPTFRAKMKHSAATIQKLIQTQYDVFQFKKKLIHLGISMALIFFGLYADQTMFMPIICLFLGCLMLTSLNLQPRSQAKEVIKQMGGKFPKSDYTFTDEGFKFYDKGDVISYGALIRLVEDKQYLYLYVSQQSAYMVDKGTVTGGTLEDLKDWLKIKTGLSWTRPASLLNFRLQDLSPSDSKNAAGPRLKDHR